jgi:hypothetical protein
MAASIAIPGLVMAALLAPEEPRALVLAQPVVRLGDLVDVASAPAALRQRAVRLEIAAARPGVPQTLPRAFVLARIRAQLPALAHWSSRHVAASYVVTYRPPHAVASGERCLRAQRHVAAGSVLRSEEFASVDCAQVERTASLYRYVPAERAVRARAAIAAGSVVPRFAGHGRTLAHAGDTVTLSASIGPVTVTRRVRLLQSARDGERLFAQTPEGDLLSAPFRGAGR